MNAGVNAALRVEKLSVAGSGPQPIHHCCSAGLLLIDERRVAAACTGRVHTAVTSASVRWDRGRGFGCRESVLDMERERERERERPGGVAELTSESVLLATRQPRFMFA